MKDLFLKRIYLSFFHWYKTEKDEPSDFKIIFPKNKDTTIDDLFAEPLNDKANREDLDSLF